MQYHTAYNIPSTCCNFWDFKGVLAVSESNINKLAVEYCAEIKTASTGKLAL